MDIRLRNVALIPKNPHCERGDGPCPQEAPNLMNEMYSHPGSSQSSGEDPENKPHLD